MRSRGAVSLWLLGLFVSLYTAAFALWIIVRPASHTTYILVDDLAQTAGSLLVVLVALGLIWRRRPHLFARSAQHRDPLVWPALLLLLGVLCNVIGQLLYTHQTLVLHSDAFPTIAHFAFLGTYPCFLSAILLFLSGALSPRRSIRFGVEGLLITIAVATFGWYLILGPMILSPHGLTLGWLVGLAFPLSDLLLLVCLLMLLNQAWTTAFRTTLLTLAGALLIIIAADSVYDYQVVHGGYTPGTLLDLGWPLGYMLVGCGVILLNRPSRAFSVLERKRGDDDLREVTSAPWLVWSLVPYALALAVDALTVIAAYTQEATTYNVSIDIGVYVGAAVYLAVLVAQQVFVVLDNWRLHHRLKLSRQELEESNKRLEVLASHDSLTGLPNRRAMYAALDQQLEQSRRYGFPFAVLFLDIDHFKQINDAHGHLVGDAVLRALATLLKDVLRSADIVGRWGGEEFVAILPNTDREAASIAAERLRVAVAGHTLEVRAAAHVTCSIGITVYPDDEQDRDALIEQADQAMYRAKQGGRNQVCMAEPSLLVSHDVSK